MHGIPVDGRRAKWGSSVAERLALHSRRDEATGCLVWTGTPHDDMGYARMGINRRPVYVHRAAWEVANGPIPPGMKVRHKCDNPPCIDVTHLKLGTQAENVADIFERDRADRRGERNNGARLDCATVVALRQDRKAGASYAVLASRYGVSKSQIYNIVSRRHWQADELRVVAD